MNKPIYIYVADKGFVKDFDLSGPDLRFTQYPTLAQDFDTVQQANHIIRHNVLDPVECFLLRIE
jgi:hypothetical protein